MPAPLEILSTGDRMRFMVRSEREPKRKAYLVDLLANDGAGECTCKDWNCRCWPLIEAGDKTARCKHVTVCREEFLSAVLAHMAHGEDEPPSTVQHHRH